MRDSRPTVYLDTNILSVLHYRGGDPRVLYQQLETRTWWKTERKLYQMYSSIITERELVRGSFPGQDAAIAEVKRLHYLRPTADVERCVKAYIEARLIPDTKVADAQQLAFATVHVIDYLLTWNCSHLANVDTQRRLAILNKRMRLRSPLLVSPDTIPKAGLGQQSGGTMKTKDKKVSWDGPEVQRCRDVRAAIELNVSVEDFLAEVRRLDRLNRRKRGARRRKPVVARTHS